MKPINDLYIYAEKNKIDMLYLNNSKVINLIGQNENSIESVIITRKKILVRNKSSNLFHNVENDEYLSLEEIFHIFSVVKIGLVFNKLSIEDLRMFNRYGNFCFFDISPIFNKYLFLNNEEALFRIHCAAYLTENLMKKTFYKASNFVLDEKLITNIFLEECGKVGIKNSHINITKLNISETTTPIFSIDCGISFMGYFSDITRLFSYGVPCPEIMNCLQYLMELQVSTSKIIREHMHIKDMFITLYRKHYRDPLFKYIKNGFGHGIGENVHEAYSLTSNQTWSFMNSYCFTIEPILRYNSIELRIENMYEIINGKAKRINEQIADDILILNKRATVNISDDKEYHLNPHIKIRKCNDEIYLANLNCESLAKGKMPYFKINNQTLKIIRGLQTPSNTNDLKINFPKT